MIPFRYVVQNNLIAQNDFEQIQKACLENEIDFEAVTVIPFLNELPDFTLDEKTNIYYGSTTFINNVYEKLNPRGVFYNEQAFSMANYVTHWKDKMLNAEAKVTTLSDYIKENYPDDSLWFVRPDADDKSFPGNVMSFLSMKDWHKNMLLYDDTKPLAFKKIIVGEPYNIAKEWRNFIVNGKVVASSLYRENFQLKKSNKDIPNGMLQFAEACCKSYSPSSAFVMDIALCGNEYYIIECGCINSTGFYHANIANIITSLPKAIQD